MTFPSSCLSASLFEIRLDSAFIPKRSSAPCCCLTLCLLPLASSCRSPLFGRRRRSHFLTFCSISASIMLSISSRPSQQTVALKGNAPRRPHKPIPLAAFSRKRVFFFFSRRGKVNSDQVAHIAAAPTSRRMLDLQQLVMLVEPEKGVRKKG